MKRETIRRWAIHFSALAIVLFAATAAWACPSCKEALAAGDPERAHLVRGFFWSILFMIATPFSLLTGFGTYMYVLVRRADRERAAAAAKQQDRETPETPSVASEQAADEREPVEVG